MTKINFKTIQKMCKYYTISCDYDRELVDACHYKPNIPVGDSWGDCRPDNCPFIKEDIHK